MRPEDLDLLHACGRPALTPDGRVAVVAVTRPDLASDSYGGQLWRVPTDGSGALVDMLEQFATRGINLSLIQSRPIGDALGRYRFVIDLEGHVLDERVADALLGLKRFSPAVTFLGSYPRADGTPVEVSSRYDDEAFVDARDWLRGLVAGLR